MYKTKKQFRLYDIYRQIALGKNSNIKGIRNYEAFVYHTIDEIEVSVTFYDYKVIEDSITMDVNVEAKLKKFVKRVNKKLKNCRKPGPRPRN